jgi:hypothetical protein
MTPEMIHLAVDIAAIFVATGHWLKAEEKWMQFLLMRR